MCVSYTRCCHVCAIFFFQSCTTFVPCLLTFDDDNMFQFFSGSFQAVYTKSMYFGPIISCVNRMERWSVICPKHAFTPCWIAAQYVAKGSALQCIFIITVTSIYSQTIVQLQYIHVYRFITTGVRLSV